jgi:hypothetical protein
MGDRFFDALWRIADASGALIYWLGDGNCSVVTNKAVLKTLPEDIVADVGPVRVVANGADLQDALFDEDGFEDD